VIQRLSAAVAEGNAGGAWDRTSRLIVEILIGGVR
jgi:hypothetical protein